MPVLSNEIREGFIGFSHDTLDEKTMSYEKPVKFDVFYVQYNKKRWLRKPIVVEEQFRFKRVTRFKGWNNLDKVYEFHITNRALEFLAQLKYLSGINSHRDSLFDFLDNLTAEYSANDDFGAGVIYATDKIREFLKEQQDEKA